MPDSPTPRRAADPAPPVLDTPAAVARRVPSALQPLADALRPLRVWIRGSEPGLVVFSIGIGVLSGLLASAMSGVAEWMHTALLGPGAALGLSTLRGVEPLRVLLLPVAGGLLLGLLNLALARWYPRTPVDPIEANALHGGRMTLRDGGVVAAQNLLSNGFGASVGLEAGYTQVAGGFASRLGGLTGLRRGDLRVMVGCGAAGAIAAAFDAPLTGAFYAFELVIGTYAISSLAPVVGSAVAATLVARALHGQTYLVAPGSGVAAPGWDGLALSLLLGFLCALAAIGLMRGVGTVEGWIKRAVPPAWLRPAAGGIVVGALALLSPGVLSAGHGALHVAFNTEGPVREALILLVLKAVAAAVSLGAGYRGGLFFASLLLGALVGKILAAALALAGVLADPLFLAVVGMSAFGTAVIGAPLAMTFLALETTGNFAVAASVLTAVAVSGLATRRLFGYSFATWRFQLRGEAIRSAHDVGWLRELTAGRMMRRDVRTVRADTRLTAFRRDFPLGSTERVVALDEAGLYAGVVLVPEAHAAGTEGETVAALLRHRDRVLLPALNAKEAMAAFDAAEAEALAVIDSLEGRKVLGVLTASHVLRRYGEELDKRRQEEVGLS